MRQTEGGEEEEEEEGCCLFEGLISFGKEGDGIRDVPCTTADKIYSVNRTEFVTISYNL